MKSHEKWLKSKNELTEPPPGKQADFSKNTFENADLTNMKFVQVIFNHATFSGCILDGSKFYDCKMKGVTFKTINSIKDCHFRRSDLEGAIFINCDLTGTDFSLIRKIDSNNLSYVYLDKIMKKFSYLFRSIYNLPIDKRHFTPNLTGSYFIKCNLTGVSFNAANLSKSTLLGVDIGGAAFNKTIMSGVKYDPTPDTTPSIASFFGAKDLHELTYKISPQGLYELRKELKDAGLRDEERQLTYAIMRNERIKTYHPVRSVLSNIFFELPCGWGMNPSHPFFIMLILQPIFFFPYLFALRYGHKDGIWQTWSPGRVRGDLGTSEPRILRFRWRNWRIYAFAIYFSLLSAFHLGWRDLNVGTWISRMQPREYTLRATGWVRFVSGLQSLISVYLLALAVLTYFGRPFG